MPTKKIYENEHMLHLKYFYSHGLGTLRQVFNLTLANAEPLISDAYN